MLTTSCLLSFFAFLLCYWVRSDSEGKALLFLPTNSYVAFLTV